MMTMQLHRAVEARAHIVISLDAHTACVDHRQKQHWKRPWCASVHGERELLVIYKRVVLVIPTR